MPLGFREDRRRRRRRTQWLMFKWFVALLIVAAAGVLAYDAGKRLAGSELTHQREQIDSLTARARELEALSAAQRAEIATSEAAAHNWQSLYERDVARGTTKELFEIIQQKLAAGVEAERLKTVLTATQNRRDCRREAERRKFLLAVREKDASKSSLKFARGEVAIVAFGAPATDEKGNLEAWFDVTQPVTARIIRAGKVVAEVTGTLPLEPAQIIGDREYTFSINANKARGAVDIVADSCRFP